MTTVASVWAAYCRTTASNPLPSSVETRARLCVADHLHAAIHGAGSDSATLLRNYLGWERARARVPVLMQGEPPSPVNLPTGCYFHPRCPSAMPHCATMEPVWHEVAPGHRVACHLYP